MFKKRPYFMSIKVFKFGGASLRDAENIKNVAAILTKFKAENLLIVVSAMGKTTNALEEIISSYFARDGKAFDKLNAIHQKHNDLMRELLGDNVAVFASASADVNDIFVEVEWILEDEPHDAYDYIYDQIIAVGELVSSKIVGAYLNKIGLTTTWLDARDILRTDETWREAVIDWKTTLYNAETVVKPVFTEGVSDVGFGMSDVGSESPKSEIPNPKSNGGGNFAITQGFIGSTKDNNTATLGREGSDYSAAIFSHCLNAEGMYIWKDVTGVLSGDPRVFKDVVKLDHISYEEAVEMTYYGATVVHPRTIQPLMIKNIPLYVRSFVDHDAVGTKISSEMPPVASGKAPQYPPILMAERNQIFLKISNPDFTFLVESHIRDLFDVFTKYHIFVNLLQNSGAFFYVSITHAPDRERELMRELREKFTIEEHHNLDLFTIRHPTTAAIENLTKDKRVFFDKTIPNTYQVLVG
jgi:aspartate kinase